MPDVRLLAETGVRVTRSGQRFPLRSAEEIEQEDVFDEGEGSLADRALSLAQQLKRQVVGDEDENANDLEDDSSESGFRVHSSAAKIGDAVDSLEQQLHDESNSTPLSVALLGQNGEGKSFLINLLLQVTQVRECEYALNGITAAGAQKDASDRKLRKYLLDTLEGSSELRKWYNNVTEDDVEIREGDMPQEDRDKEKSILQRVKDACKHASPPGREEKGRGFMLLSAGKGDSTTKIAVKTRLV
jgi:hypothetical protein